MKFIKYVLLSFISFFIFSSVMAEDKPYIIDVRSLEEFQSGHIEQALHMPYKEIKELIKEKIDDKNASIVLYCQAGRRAGIAQSALQDLGYTNVENGGGIKDMQKRFRIQVE